MENLEKLATFCTQDTGRRQTKAKTHHYDLSKKQLRCVITNSAAVSHSQYNSFAYNVY